MERIFNVHIDACKALMNKKEYLLALEELKCAMEILQEIAKNNEDFPYEQKYKELILYRQSAMNGIIRDAKSD